MNERNYTNDLVLPSSRPYVVHLAAGHPHRRGNDIHAGMRAWALCGKTHGVVSFRFNGQTICKACDKADRKQRQLMESPSELAEPMTERDELLQMWDTLCFEPCGTFLGGVVCTEPRGHEDGHCCTFETLDRYHAVRRAKEADQRMTGIAASPSS